jgi:hypothetical protein
MSITKIKTWNGVFFVSKEIGLEVNADKTKYIVMFGDQNAERSQNIKTDIIVLGKGGRVQIFGYNLNR